LNEIEAEPQRVMALDDSHFSNCFYLHLSCALDKTTTTLMSSRNLCLCFSLTDSKGYDKLAEHHSHTQEYEEQGS
jgi:hypothetical protein